uniref:Uncharacterized protein n=1 Tax=Anopheles culicifacies TaxID=139723 RepID=A0A182MC21_9DIPT
MSSTPPVHVVEAIHAFVAKLGIREPRLTASSGSRNGDSYSGDVYRIIISPGSRDIEDFENNNNTTHSSSIRMQNGNGETKVTTVDANGNEDADDAGMNVIGDK